MKSHAWCLTAFLVLLTNSSHPANAMDWPQWQGPDRNAISKETGLLQEWPSAGPSLAWRIEGLGGGDSAPAVAHGKLFGMSNRDGQEIVWALSEADGKEVWATPLGDAVQQQLPQSKEGPGCTPAIDGDHLYVIGMGGRLACLNVRYGKILWQRSFTQDFGGVAPMWNYRESPLIDGDKLICTPGGPDATMVAINKHTGETLWQMKLPGDPAQPAGDSPNRPGQSPPPSRGPGNSPPAVTGTSESGLYLGEHWGMTAFTQKVPNGKYVANLHFAETFDGITAEGQRVFTFNIEGQEYKDFDIWAKAGGAKKAYVESVPVEVTDGEFRIDFTRQVENPTIRAIEIIPQSEDAKEEDTIRIKAGQAAPFKDSTGKVWLADRGFEGGQSNSGTFNFGGPPGDGFGGGRGRGRGFGGPRPAAAYSSAIAIDVDGERQYVQLTARTLMGVAASDGRLLWRYDRPANQMGINCSTPLFEDGLVFAASAYGNGGGAVKVAKGDSGEFTAEEVYFTPNMQNHHGGMIVSDGALYGAKGGNEGGFLTCMEFQTGKVLWRSRKAPKGSLAMADGRLYLRAEDGGMFLIEPSREGLVERGHFDQPDRSAAPAWAHPIIANGKLYVRDQDLLLCYDIRAN